MIQKHDDDDDDDQASVIKTPSVFVGVAHIVASSWLFRPHPADMETQGILTRWE